MAKTPKKAAKEIEDLENLDLLGDLNSDLEDNSEEFSLITREYSGRLKKGNKGQQQLEAIKQSIRTTQFFRNKGIRYWLDNWGAKRKDLQRLSKILSKDPQYPWAPLLNSSARQVGLDRGWKSIANFFANCRKKKPGKKGFPQFKNDVRSVEYKQSGWKLDPSAKAIDFTDGNLIGKIRLIGSTRKRKDSKGESQPSLGDYAQSIQRVRIVLEKTGKIQVQFLIRVPKRQLERVPTGQIRGEDVGLIDFITDDLGQTVKNPRFLKAQEKKLKRLQRQHSRKGTDRTGIIEGRKKKGTEKQEAKVEVLKSPKTLALKEPKKKGTRPQKTKNRQKSKTRVSKVHQKISRQRKDFAIKQARALIISNDITFYEKLKLQEFIRTSKYAKSISDAAWGQFFQWLKRFSQMSFPKALAIEVSAFDSSNECSNCHRIQKKSLKQRWHICLHCFLILPRDQNSGIILKQRGLVQLGIKNDGTAGQTETLAAKINRSPLAKKLVGLRASASLGESSRMKSSEEKLRVKGHAPSSKKEPRIPRL